MKKPYFKPQVYAEAFELMEHVAGNCLVNDGFAGAHARNANDCSYSDGPSLSLFKTADNGCMPSIFTGAGVDLPDPTNPDDIRAKIAAIGMECYNSFLTTGQLFAS